MSRGIVVWLEVPVAKSLSNLLFYLIDEEKGLSDSDYKLLTDLREDIEEELEYA